MELFSEIYGKYYKLIASLLTKLPLTRQEINGYVTKEGFAESNLYLLPKLLDKNGWPLLTLDKDKYTSKIASKVVLPATNLEKRWLKAICLDIRCTIFFTQEERTALLAKLAVVEPLYQQADFKYFAQCLDGDPFADNTYIANFRTILQALREKRVVYIKFVSGRHHSNGGNYVPLKLEYSTKDNKFRIYCAKIVHSSVKGCYIINMARVTAAQAREKYAKPLPSIASYIEALRCKQPIVVKVSKERNALERFMIEFSPYEKRAEMDEQTGICTVKLYYQTMDETEILIKLLSFGPVIEIVGPASFVKAVKNRIKVQKELLF